MSAESEQQWRPYVGPEGGTGWTNGDDVNYDDEPPGELDVEAAEETIEELSGSEGERNELVDLFGLSGEGLFEDDSEDQILSVDELEDSLVDHIDSDNRREAVFDDELQDETWDIVSGAVNADVPVDDVVESFADRLDLTEGFSSLYDTDDLVGRFAGIAFERVDTQAEDELAQRLHEYSEKPEEFPNVSLEREGEPFENDAPELENELSELFENGDTYDALATFNNGEETFGVLESFVRDGGNPSDAVLATASVYDEHTLPTEDVGKVADQLSKFVSDREDLPDSEAAEELLFEFGKFDRDPDNYPREESDERRQIVERVQEIIDESDRLVGTSDVTWHTLRSEMADDVVEMIEGGGDISEIVEAVDIMKADEEQSGTTFYKSIAGRLSDKPSRYGDLSFTTNNTEGRVREYIREEWQDEMTEAQEEHWDLDVSDDWFFSVYEESTAPLFEMAAEMTGNKQIPDDDPEVYDVFEQGHDFDDETLETYEIMAENAREVIREWYGEEVTVYRGLSDTGEYSDAEGTGIAEQLNEASENGETIEMPHRTLESWSIDPMHARKFTGVESDGESTGAIIEQTIPVESVMACSMNGGLSSSEDELVVAHDESAQYEPDQIIEQGEVEDGAAEIELLRRAKQFGEPEDGDTIESAMSKTVEAEVEIEELPPVNWLHQIDTEQEFEEDGEDGPDTIENAQLACKTEKEWEVYVGDDGGTGWQNTEDPDDVRYQDEPPGDVNQDQLQNFVEFTEDVSEEEQLQAFSGLGLIESEDGPAEAAPQDRKDPRVEIDNLAEAAMRVRQAPEIPTGRFEGDWTGFDDYLVTEGTIVEVATEEDTNFTGQGRKGIVTEINRDDSKVVVTENGEKHIVEPRDDDVTLQQVWMDQANYVATGRGFWDDGALADIPDEIAEEMGYENGMDVDDMNTGERLENAFEAAAKRTEAREYGIQGGNTTGDEMDILEYEDGSIDFAVPTNAYDSWSDYPASDGDEAAMNNRDSPKVIEAFGGDACETRIVEDGGERYIVKEGLEGQTWGEFKEENGPEEVELETIDTLSAAFFVGNVDLHRENLFVTEDLNVSVIDHDNHGGMEDDSPADIDSIVTVGGVDQAEVRKSVYEKAIEFAEGNRELPDDLSDNHREYVSDAVDMVVQEAAKEPQFSVPDGVAPDVEQIDTEPAIDTFDELGREEITFIHPETGLVEIGFISNQFDETEAAVSVQGGGSVVLTDPSVVIDKMIGQIVTDAELACKETAADSDDQWQPYIGPEGGTGWTDGDEVLYDEELPGEIDEEAVDEFLDQIPEEDRQQAREALGLDTEVDMDELVEQIEHAGGLAGEGVEKVVYEKAKEGIDPDTIVDAVEQADELFGVDPKRILQNVTGGVEGIDESMPLINTTETEFDEEFIEDRLDEREQDVQQSCAFGWIGSMFTKSTLPLFKAASRLTDNDQAMGAPDETDLFYNDQIESVDPEKDVQDLEVGDEVWVDNGSQRGTITSGFEGEDSKHRVELEGGFMDRETEEFMIEDMESVSEKTTEVFREAFGDTITVYRGYSKGGHNPTNAEVTDVSEGLEQAAKEGQSIEHEHRACESWSINPKYASGYASGGESGAMLEKEVPVERIMISSHTSPLAGGEDEIVVAHDESEVYGPDQIITQDTLTDMGEYDRRLLEASVKAVSTATDTETKIDKQPVKVGMKPNPQWLHEMNESEIELARKENQWQPYVGPQGGTGWTDGDDVLYDEKPDNIDQEAVDTFLNELPEEDREEAREALGVVDEQQVDRELSDGELITGSVADDLERAGRSGTQADVEAVLEEYDTSEVSEVDSTSYYSLPTIERGDPEVATVHENGDVEVMDIGELLRDVGDGHFDDVSYEELLGHNPKERIGEEIYQTAGTNFHATEPESAVEIIASGELQARNETRGISNRNMGSAVFTSDHAPNTVFGDVVFEVDVDAMAEDGFKPPAGKEPPVEEARAREAVAREFRVMDFRPQLEQGMSRGTDVFYDDIPLEYVDIDAEEDVVEQIENEIQQRYEDGELSEEQYEQAKSFLNGDLEPTGADSQHIEEMEESGYVSHSDAPDLRIENAESTKNLSEGDAQLGASADHMEIATFDGGREAFVKHFGETMQRDETGEKPTLGERAIAADTFLRNIGFDDNPPAHFLNRDPDTDDFQYKATERVEGEEVRFADDDMRERVDTEEAKDFAKACMLMGNSDMHADNVIIDPEGSVRPVDLEKSGGDFSSGSRFRRRGSRMILRTLSKLGIDITKEELFAEVEELAQEIDVDQAMEGVQNSELSDESHHQFADNIAKNIRAFAEGEY